FSLRQAGFALIELIAQVSQTSLAIRQLFFKIRDALSRGRELPRQLVRIPCTGTKRRNFPIAVGELPFQIAHAATERAVLPLGGGQFVGQPVTLFFESR